MTPPPPIDLFAADHGRHEPPHPPIHITCTPDNMRLAYYAGASTAAAAACLLKAFHQRPNFYSATVYLSQSNACLLILTNLLLVMACSFIYGLQRLLYGPLRPIEIEQLSEKAWYAVLDTLLAMPSFREDVGGWLLTMFVLLLAAKVWGWIGEGRVDVLEQQPPANPRLFHARLATSLIVSVVFDIWVFNYCVESVVADPRPGMMVIFTFEFAIQCIFSVFTLARYALSLAEAGVVKKQTIQAIDLRKSEIKEERRVERERWENETVEEGQERRPEPPSMDEPIEVDENEVDVPGWEEKRRYLFGLEVFTYFIKLMIYIVFFTVSITFNGLPMHIMRDVYMTFASFSKRVSDYVAYRKATSDMNARYPDATTEEIRDDACIVCRESMVAWEQPNAQAEAQPAGEQQAGALGATRRRDEGLRAKKLPCGHILHLRCLKAWLERQQVCPTCRRPVITATPASGNNAGGAGGGNAPGQGPPGQQQPPRPRARMFNLGPLRIGLLNAPNGQMQNILNQIQNPEGQNQNQNRNQHQQQQQNQDQPPNANQQGPNHLGLQVPYATRNVAAPPGPRISRAQVPNHIQLLQLEQRLMQEAHNLGIEQQQLVHLRMMEAELARLRAQHIPAQQPVGTNGAQQQAPPQPQLFPQAAAHGFLPPQPTFPFQHGPMPQHQHAQALQGSTTQQLSNGHHDLPAGLVLPEGWTATPLRRVDGTMPTAAHPQSIRTSVPNVPTAAGPQPLDALRAAQSLRRRNVGNFSSDTGTPAAVDAQSGTPSPSGAASRANEMSSTTEQARASREPRAASVDTSAHDQGPTNGRGSPLFVPVQVGNGDITTNRNEVPPQPSLPINPLANAHSEQSLPTAAPPWGSGGWNFDRNAESNSANGAAMSSAGAPNVSGASESNGHSSQPEGEHQQEEQQGYSGKGKGKAVEVEDVPDQSEDR